MTERDFVYWLQGFSEITQRAPTKHEWKIIQEHLKLVFNKETPLYNSSQIGFPKFEYTPKGIDAAPLITC